MKRATLVMIILCVAALAHAAGESKTIRVDKTKFSNIYPAVWFSPSTGEITSLKKRSEVPPETKYEIWIEPNDPEFGYIPGKDPKTLGFALLGEGLAVFEDSKIPTNPRLKPKLTHLMRKTAASKHPVFYCKAKTSTCLIMITAMDKKEGVIEFKWRLLAKDKPSSGKNVRP